MEANTQLPEQAAQSVTPGQAAQPVQQPFQAAPAAPRRRRRRPTWQRNLIKYWPPVRFGLLVLILVMILVLIITLVLA